MIACGWKKRYLLALLFLFLLHTVQVRTIHAQAGPTAVDDEESAPLLVGVHYAPPFVFQQEETWDGIALTLWRQIAEEMEIEYEVILRVITQPGWQEILTRYMP